MKVRIQHLATSLADFGYSHRTCAVLDGIAFVRATDAPLHQWIWMTWSGHRDEAIVALACVALGKCVTTKGLIEDRLIHEIAQNKERCWTIIETDKAAREWEEQLIQVVPPIVDALATERGPELLRRTETTRAAVTGYLDKLRSVTCSENRLHSLKQLASADVLLAAERLAEWPGVLHLLGAEDDYLLSCLTIVLFSSEVEADGRDFRGADPLRERLLMWRIQLIADELLYEKRIISDGLSCVGSPTFGLGRP
jgi:hypothetical protein